MERKDHSIEHLLLLLKEGRDRNIEYLFELLKEERSRRQAAENEVKVLQTMLEPLQQKELDRIRKAREVSLRDLREKNTGHVHGAESRGRIVCDCGDCDQHLGYDEVD